MLHFVQLWKFNLVKLCAVVANVMLVEWNVWISRCFGMDCT